MVKIGLSATPLRIVTLALGLFTGLLLYAQAPAGTITGTVTDSSGAVIPGATVTITDKATNTGRNATANAAGLFSAPSLPPGDYEVRATLQGFRTTERDAQVVAGSTTTVDMSMTVGESREVVTVEAASAQINYDSHSVAGIIPRESIADIPLNGRNSLQLALARTRRHDRARVHFAVSIRCSQSPSSAARAAMGRASRSTAA